MQHMEVSGAVRPLKWSLGIKWLIILPLAVRPLLRVTTIRRTTDTFLFISHTTNVLLFKFRCNIFNAGFGSEWDTLYKAVDRRAYNVRD